MEKNGIDISHHQGNIDFDQLKGNIDFAMVRTSYGFFNEDKKYKRNIEELERIGVPYGLYHFSYATNEQQAKQEAEGFLNIIKNYNPTYPVVVDIESVDTRENTSNDTLINIANTFCSTVENAGYYVMIYANLNYLNTKLNNQVLDKYDKWLAQWTTTPSYNKEYGIWQYSSKGNKPGINGYVDLDKAFKDYPSIIKKNINDSDNTSQNIANEINYIVKKGDTLSAIAAKFDTTYQALAKYNNIENPNLIYENQNIKIPNTKDILPTTYVVKKGDTLIKIASKYNMSWNDLYNKNKTVIGGNPNLIKPGEVLEI